MRSLIQTLLPSAVAGFVGWVGRGWWGCIRETADRNRIYAWLRSNTQDVIGQSHLDVVAIAKATHLSEARVRRA